MNPIKVEMTVDEAKAGAIPALRPLLGKRVELIALQIEGEVAQARKRRTPDELLAARLTPPPGVAPITLDGMEKAVEKGVPVQAIDPRVRLREKGSSPLPLKNEKFKSPWSCLWAGGQAGAGHWGTTFR